MTIPKNTTYARVYSMALEIFKYDKDKAHTWWLSKNPLLDGKAPYEMVKEGKARRLIKLFNRCMI